MLTLASDELSNNGCNDWDFPEDWTVEEQKEFVKEMYEDNGDPQNYNPDYLHVPDWWVASFLASKLKDM